MTQEQEKQKVSPRVGRFLSIGKNANTELRDWCRKWRMECFALPSVEDALRMLDRGFSFDVGLLRFDGTPTEPGRLSELKTHRAAKSALLLLLAEERAKLNRLPPGFVELSHPLSYPELDKILTAHFDAGTAPATRQIIPAPATDSRSGKHPGRALVAEDNPVNRKVARRILERMGFTVDTANDGVEALGHLEKKRYDILLLDIHMPRMGGRETMAALCRRTLPEARPRVFALTATANEAEIQGCLDAGMEALLAKPLREEELRAYLSGKPLEIGREGRPEPEGPKREGETSVQRQLESLGKSLGAEATAELVRVFLQSAADQVQRLRRAIDKTAFEDISHAAHQLKGSCAQIGAESMAALCLELEIKGEQGLADGLTETRDQLTREFARLKKTLPRISF